MLSELKILIIEPNLYLTKVYDLLPSTWQIDRVNTVDMAVRKLQNISPNLVFISSSYSITKCIVILESVKNLSVKQLIPIIFVLDFSNKVSCIPGTTWGGTIGIIHSLSSKRELFSTLNRILQ